MLPERVAPSPVKDSVRQKLSLAHFVIAVRETAAGEAEAEIRVGAEQLAEAQFRIEIDRGDGEAQGEVGVVQEIGLVVIKKGVAGNGRAAFDGLVVAELEQFAFDRVNLGEGRRTG